MAPAPEILQLRPRVFGDMLALWEEQAERLTRASLVGPECLSDLAEPEAMK